MNIHLPAILGFTRYQGFDPSPCFNSWRDELRHFFVKILAGAIVWCLRNSKRRLVSPRWRINSWRRSKWICWKAQQKRGKVGISPCTSDCWFLSLISLIFVWFKTDSTISSVSLIIIDTWFCREFLICIGCNNASHGPWFSEGQSDEWRIRGFPQASIGWMVSWKILSINGW